jgi:hypothetical protein
MSEESRLKPYKSLLLARLAAGVRVAGSVDSILGDVEELVRARPNLSVMERHGQVRTGELYAGHLRYLERRPVTWTSEDIVDRIHHLIVVCRRRSHVAIFASDTGLRSVLARHFGDPESHEGLGSLARVDASVLNAVFVRGPTRTLWLSGTHRRTSVKADGKVLSGVDLRDALDPLDDQTYFFSAARSKLDFSSTPVGVSPRRSSLWAGTSADWTDFRDTVARALAELDGEIAPDNAPLPVLAVPTTDPGAVADAFDVGLQAPELLSGDPTDDAATREDAERWGYGAVFDVIETAGPDFRCDLRLHDTHLGTLSVAVDVSDAHRVRCTVTAEPASEATRADLEEARERCSRRSWITVRYDSGHTVSDGVVYETRFRDVSFSGFRWAELGDVDRHREKPPDLNETGLHQSLFDWVARQWPNLDGTTARPGGWLACDDGSMEIADFIHLDESTDLPTLSLIHVKAAKTNDPGREISVAAYEVVVAQAVKNLRHLDRSALAAGLEAGIQKEVGDLVWHDHEESDRDAMIAALSALGTNYRRQLVILQPQVTQSRHESARSGSSPRDQQRLRQLDLLLLGADADAHALAATFVVLGDAV